ncbi:MAG: hypothetical protein D6731_06685 [Planctomycetota bacterium]|nr:MAG: hypothetical protein D6731_06685 [Planctomycetota bacterium]
MTSPVRDPVLREVLARAPRPAPTQPARTLAARTGRTRGRASERRKCTYALPGDLADALRAVCAAQGVTQREVVEAVLRSYVEQHRPLLARPRRRRASA